MFNNQDNGSHMPMMVRKALKPNTRRSKVTEADVKPHQAEGVQGIADVQIVNKHLSPILSGVPGHIQ